MLDNYGLTQPGPEAAPEAGSAYRQAWSERAMAARRQHLQTLHSELRAKIGYADCERALTAFTQVLDAGGIDAWTASHAQFKLECWDDGGFPEDGGLSEQEGKAATVWCDAVEAGRVELCDKAPFVSDEAFGLVDFLGRDSKQTFAPVFPLSILKV